MAGKSVQNQNHLLSNAGSCQLICTLCCARILSIALGETKKTQGTGKQCHHGTKCKRRDCRFAHKPIKLLPKVESTKKADSIEGLLEHCGEMAGRKENLVERQKAGSIEGLLEHCGEMAGRKENLVERQNVYEDAIAVPVILNLADAFSRHSQTQAQGALKKMTEEGNGMAQYLFGKILRDDKTIVLGMSGVQRRQLHKLWE
jgi:hypothetical protein